MRNGLKLRRVPSPVLFVLKRIQRTGTRWLSYWSTFPCTFRICRRCDIIKPHHRRIKSLINTCEKFAIFNLRKTLYIFFGLNCRQVTLNSTKIPWQISVKHHGNYLSFWYCGCTAWQHMVAKSGRLALASLMRWMFPGVSYFLAWLGINIFIFNTKDVLSTFFMRFYFVVILWSASLPR